jgi:hypothetical protein
MDSGRTMFTNPAVVADYRSFRHSIAWLVHPRPKPRESMESWIVRQAHANGYSNPSKFAIAYLMFARQGVTFDFDFSYERDQTFRIAAAHVDDGPESAFRMTLGPFRGILDLASQRQRQQGRSRWGFHWITPSREGRRFCPLCLAVDETPYLRLVWRLTLAPICPMHKTFLTSECGNCSNTFNPFDDNPNYDLGKCAHCGSPLSSTPPRAVSESGIGCEAVSSLLRILNCKAETTSLDRFGNAPELFSGLRLIIELLMAITEFPVKALDDVSRAYSLLEQAWKLLHDPDELATYIVTLTQNYMGRYPEFLKRFLRMYVSELGNLSQPSDLLNRSGTWASFVSSHRLVRI